MRFPISDYSKSVKITSKNLLKKPFSDQRILPHYIIVH